MVDEISFRRAKNGDGESFYKLLEPIKDKLYRVAVTYMRNEYDALDCVHESIVKAIQSIDKLKKPQYFNTWITRITINTCKEHLRKTKDTSPYETAGLEDKLIYNNSDFEENIDLYAALDHLKENEKELIVMRYMNDMSTSDIAEATHAPVGTVRSRLSRTVKKLRLYMEGESR